MKILVIDDNKTHLDAALQTLVGHDVTICSSHEKAEGLLKKQYNKQKTDELCAQYRAAGMSFNEYYNTVLKESLLPYWDVVLCDLLMQPSPREQSNEGLHYVTQGIMPVGWSLALRAAKNGAKFVAVVTDVYNDDHPASAMLDYLHKHIFAIDGAKMLLTNHVSLIGIIGTERTCTKCRGFGKCITDRGSVYTCCHCKAGIDFSQKGKDWGRVLNEVMGIKEEPK